MQDDFRPSLTRRIIGLVCSAALLVLGLSGMLYWLGNGGRALIFIGAATLFIAGIFWIKEDWFPRRQ
jgi:xanthine/uracil permease